jgi:uncharacterized RDD family membrane protein YckC
VPSRPAASPPVEGAAEAATLGALAPGQPAASRAERISATFPSLADTSTEAGNEAEEQFSASVAGRQSAEANQENENEDEPRGPQHRVRTRYVPPEPLPEAAPRTVASAPPEHFDPPYGSAMTRTRSGIEREFAERTGLEQELDRRAEYWRDEVARTVQSYRTRRSRKRLAGEFSMKLDFDGARELGAARAAAAALRREEEEEFAEQEFVDEPEATESLPPSMPARAHQQAPEFLEEFDFSLEPEAAETNVIEFPRPASFEQPCFDGLAEPIFDKPRILDVPETVANAAPASLANVALEAEETDDALPLTAEFDIPLQGAPWPQRCSAALLDGLVVVVATDGFAMIVARFTTGIPHTRAALAMAVLVPFVFWAVYQYLFLVYAGSTPGMQMAHLQVSTFEGEWTPRGLRRWRALVMMLSGASLGLGFLWALFDEDNLCWHDRMTRTYLKAADR